MHTGVGVAIEDQFLGSIPNNSVIVNSGSRTNILCHSASKTSCSGQWFSPVGEPAVSEQASDRPSECTSLLYSYANLTVVGDLQETSGIYTCTINDENDVQQSIYVGVYNSVQEVEQEGQYTLCVFIPTTSLVHCETCAFYFNFINTYLSCW